VKCTNCQKFYYALLHPLISFSHFGADTQVFLSTVFFQTQSLKVYCEAGIVRYTFRYALRVNSAMRTATEFLRHIFSLDPNMPLVISEIYLPR
jgi:hypothetical protein